MVGTALAAYGSHSHGYILGYQETCQGITNFGCSLLFSRGCCLFI